MTKVADRFLRYIKVDTQSMDDQEAFPSTEKQKELGRILVEELKAIGATSARMDDYGYVYAEIPGNTDKKVPALGFISHMDTAPVCSGKDVNPQLIEHYNGGVVCLGKDPQNSMSPQEYPELLDYIEQDLITTDGTTLLGADDKAGVAEIMTMAEYLLNHPEIPHGKICIGFTPDEEVGRGAEFFDVKGFGADVAFTVDGGAIGELEYENFNAASATIMIHGVSIHPGSARGRMKNALLMGMELHSMLPAFENPACTDGYEGFFHLNNMEGDVELAKLHYIIRDHDMDKFHKKKALMEQAVGYLNTKYGEGTAELELKDTYYNMKEKIEPHKYLLDVAESAMRKLDIEPKICPIRGGTDGARLSYMGLPCPNLCTGGHNFHGRHEFISVQSMEKITCLLTEIVKGFYEKSSGRPTE
ncbi:peptidase T [Clostridium sp. AN503]|uniref:peptidase T n=1 Tax=Clostridium sp. AN503 TaxID=3160598 RepID=UPI0034577AA4